MNKKRYSPEQRQDDIELLSNFKKLTGIHSTNDCHRFALRFAIMFWNNRLEVKV